MEFDANKMAREIAETAVNSIEYEWKTIAERIELIKDAKVRKWISVKDGLPEVGGSYLVVVKEKFPHEKELQFHEQVLPGDFFLKLNQETEQEDLSCFLDSVFLVLCRKKLFCRLNLEEKDNRHCNLSLQGILSQNFCSSR